MQKLCIRAVIQPVKNWLRIYGKETKTVDCTTISMLVSLPGVHFKFLLDELAWALFTCVCLCHNSDAKFQLQAGQNFSLKLQTNKLITGLSAAQELLLTPSLPSTLRWAPSLVPRYEASFEWIVMRRIDVYRSKTRAYSGPGTGVSVRVA